MATALATAVFLMMMAKRNSKRNCGGGRGDGSGGGKGGDCSGNFGGKPNFCRRHHPFPPPLHGRHGQHTSLLVVGVRRLEGLF